MDHDPINHPEHYCHSDKMECIDAIAAALGPEGFQAYCRGTIIKYSWRIEHKGAGSQDLGKIGWYADKAIAARKTFTPPPKGIQVEMGPYEVAMFAMGSLQALERMVTVEGKPLTNGGQAKILQAFAVAQRLVHNPKVMAPLPVMPPGNRTSLEPPLWGMTGTEFEEVMTGIEALRRAAKIGDDVTRAGVLFQAVSLLGLRAMGDALTRSGFVKPPAATEEPIHRSLVNVAHEVSRIAHDTKGQAFEADSTEGLAIHSLYQNAAVLAEQVRPCR
jgi:hypothetical protein